MDRQVAKILGRALHHLVPTERPSDSRHSRASPQPKTRRVTSQLCCLLSCLLGPRRSSPPSLPQPRLAWLAWPRVWHLRRIDRLREAARVLTQMSPDCLSDDVPRADLTSRSSFQCYSEPTFFYFVSSTTTGIGPRAGGKAVFFFSIHGAW